MVRSERGYIEGYEAWLCRQSSERKFSKVKSEREFYSSSDSSLTSSSEFEMYTNIRMRGLRRYKRSNSSSSSQGISSSDSDEAKKSQMKEQRDVLISRGDRKTKLGDSQSEGSAPSTPGRESNVTNGSNKKRKMKKSRVEVTKGDYGPSPARSSSNSSESEESGSSDSVYSSSSSGRVWKKESEKTKRSLDNRISRPLLFRKEMDPFCGGLSNESNSSESEESGTSESIYSSSSSGRVWKKELKKTKRSLKNRISRPLLFRKEMDPFCGGLSNEKEAREWLNTYKHLALSAQWNDRDKVKHFRVYLEGSAKAWLRQLNTEVRRKWKPLEQKFREDYCKRDISKLQFYYELKRDPRITVLDYIWELNAAAKKARVDINKGRKGSRDHVKQFLYSVQDEFIVNCLAPLRCRNMEEVRAVIKDMIRNRTYDPNISPSTWGGLRATEGRVNRSSNMRLETLSDWKNDSSTDSEESEGTSREGSESCREGSGWSNGSSCESEESEGTSKEGSDCREWISEISVTNGSMVDYPPRRKGGKVAHKAENFREELFCTVCQETGHMSDKCCEPCTMCRAVHGREECEVLNLVEAVRRMKIQNKTFPEELEQHLNFLARQ